MRGDGFSLVELSIVLVILGLLTGGILAGQSLIRASELRAVISEYQRYHAATHTFRDKYLAYPGDLRNATRFWGDDNAACADAAIPNGTPGTCNGNGDGRIDPPGGANLTGEVFQFWKQLALAGLIEGTYSGLSGPGSMRDAVLTGSAANSPTSKLSNAGWSAEYFDNSGGAIIWPFNMNFGNNFIFGVDAGTNQLTRAQVLRTEEAWNIDTKLDDGKPGRGKIVVDGTVALTSCADAGGVVTAFDAPYLLSNSAIACSLRFIHQF